MKLGIIGWIDEETFQNAKAKELEFIELDVNDKVEEFLQNIDQIKEDSQKYDIPIAAVGRWGSNRIQKEGICEQELQIEYDLIDATSQLDCDIYITGCNYVDVLSYYENCQLAIAYFEKLIEYGSQKGVKIATYNCRWNNFVCTPMAFTIIHGYLKNLYIKYDTSHCIYDGGDYLQETAEWGDRFIHVHLKGALVVNGSRFDDPPAGLDQTNWGAFLSVLYAKGYEGGLSIEPHSRTWAGDLGERGINYTIEYFRRLMV